MNVVVKRRKRGPLIVRNALGVQTPCFRYVDELKARRTKSMSKKKHEIRRKLLKPIPKSLLRSMDTEEKGRLASKRPAK